MRPFHIYLDKVIIEASDTARVTVLDRERKLIKAQFDKLFKKQIQDLEANILAYQDLLMTKEILIKSLEQQLYEAINGDVESLKKQIETISETLEDKIKIIEDYKQKFGKHDCKEHESDDELTKGECTRAKLKRRVFKKIEEVHDYVKNQVTPEIHEKYEGEIRRML